MSPKFTVSLLFVFALLPGCQSPQALRPDLQALVEKIAKEHTDIVRLTVHTEPPGGGSLCAVASTSADKLGKPSDPEDLRAIETGKAVVLDEAGAVDVTVPVLQRAGQWKAAVGVTLRGAAGQTQEQATAKATQIAKTIEAELAKSS
jgi:hypothetical protein